MLAAVPCAGGERSADGGQFIRVTHEFPVVCFCWLRQIRYLKAPVFVVDGDSVSESDVKALEAFHCELTSRRS